MKASVLVVAAAGLVSAAYGQRPSEPPSWAPKPEALAKYVPPNKPHTRIADLEARHKGQAEWREPIVRDKTLYADYVSSAPGTKVSKRFHSDTREWWIVMRGKIRFEIEGQEPFVAVKGSMVQAPYQTMHSIETIGDEPSLRFEVNIAGARTLYPGSEDPPTAPGIQFISVRLNRKPAPYDHGNLPHINLYELAKKGGPKYSGGRFVHDDRGVANILYGYEKDLPPYDPQIQGHIHPECAEFWLMMAGEAQFPIEGQKMFLASEGDVVYVPPLTFHAPRFHGEGPSCRLAMSGYTGIAVLVDSPAAH